MTIQQTLDFVSKMRRLGSVPALVVMSIRNILEILQDQRTEIRQLREQLDLQARQIQDLSRPAAHNEWPAHPRSTPNNFGPSLAHAEDWKLGAKVPHC